jgi:hypothetical protein
MNINGPAVCTGSINCTQAQIATGLPIPWERPFIYWMSLFNACYDADTVPCTGTHTGNPGNIAHYAAVSWSSQIDYNRLGCNVGGECYVYAAAEMRSVFGFDTNGIELMQEWAWGAGQVYQANATTWKSLAPTWATMAAMNECNNGCGTAYQQYMPNLLAAYAVAAGYKALGSEGLQQSDLTNTATAGYPCSQSSPASNGVICVFSTYHTTMTWLEQQTDGDSCGPGAVQINCSTIQANTGTLVNLLPFATQHWTNALEPYATDIACTYDPNYVFNVTFGSGITPYPCGYGTAFGNASIGVPSVTSVVGGNATVGGNAVIQ